MKIDKFKYFFFYAFIFFSGTFFAHAAEPGSVTINTNLPGPYSVSSTGPVAIIGNAYYFALALGGLLAFGSIVYAGITWASSQGNPSKISDAKDQITQAFLGLILLFGAYIILNTVNPALTVLNIPALSSLPTSTNAGGAAAVKQYACQDASGANAEDTSGTGTTCHASSDCNNACAPDTTCRESPSCSSAQCDFATLAQKSNVPYPFVNAPELISLMQCIEGNPNVIGAGGAPGTKFTKDINHPSCNYTRGKPLCDSSLKCSHAQNSCHYGGRSGSGGSLAVDYAATGQLGYRIVLGARACGVPANKARCENNSGQNMGYDQSTQSCNSGTTHVHVSAPGCDAN